MENSDSSSYYLLRWSDHITNYADMFLTLREEEEFLDCSIACHDGMVGAHRVVLAGCSSYLRDLLKHSSNPHPIIFLLETPRKTVLLLMEFIYRGQAHIPHSQLRQLVTLGKAMKIKGLSQIHLPNRYEPILERIPRLHGLPDVDDNDRQSEYPSWRGPDGMISPLRLKEVSSSTVQKNIPVTPNKTPSLPEERAVDASSHDTESSTLEEADDGSNGQGKEAEIVTGKDKDKNTGSASESLYQNKPKTLGQQQQERVVELPERSAVISRPSASPNKPKAEESSPKLNTSRTRGRPRKISTSPSPVKNGISSKKPGDGESSSESISISESSYQNKPKTLSQQQQERVAELPKRSAAISRPPASPNRSKAEESSPKLNMSRARGRPRKISTTPSGVKKGISSKKPGDGESSSESIYADPTYVPKPKSKQTVSFDKLSKTPQQSKKEKTKRERSESPSASKKRKKDLSDKGKQILTKQKKNVRGKSKTKAPIYKTKALSSSDTLGRVRYKAKWIQREVGSYALKHGIKASQRYSKKKYGVKMREKTIASFMDIYKNSLKEETKQENEEMKSKASKN